MMFHSPLFLVFLLPLVVFGQDSTEIGAKIEENVEQVVDDVVSGVEDQAEAIGDNVKNEAEKLENLGENVVNGTLDTVNKTMGEIAGCFELGKIEFAINEAWDAVEDAMAELMDVPAVLFKNLINEGIDAVRKPVDDIIGELKNAKEKVDNEVNKFTMPTMPSIPDITLPPVTIPTITIPQVTMPPVTMPPVTLPPVTLPPVTMPPVTLPEITLPPVTLPPVKLPSWPSWPGKK